MSKEVKRYEVTVLLDASSSYTVEADSVEAAEHAAWEAHDEASPSLCHQCSGSMDLGDAYGMLIYCDGNEVADTTHDAREIADLRAELDALLAERDRLAAENERLARDAKNDSIAYRAVIERQEELRAEVEALNKDAERLDRLDIECEAYGCEGIHEGNRWMIDGPFRTVRDAIDAVLQGAQP